MQKVNLYLIGLLSIAWLISCDTSEPDPLEGVTEALAASSFENSFANNGNSVNDPAFSANSLQPTSTPGTTSSAPSGLENVSYRGAVAPDGTPWYAGWSTLDNILAGDETTDALNLPTDTVVVTDNNGAGTGTVTWTKDKLWIIEGIVFVNSGDILTIQPGTIVQGRSGQGLNSSALIVARGAKILAEGTAAEPIIFTFRGDQGNTSVRTRGQWGGLILLGQARINTTLGVFAIEGIPPTEQRGFFGGTDDTDDSGVLKYVSVRHGGTNIGEGNEINGLTLGGVGSGTVIDYVEIVGNNDDGIEWFGGTVGVTHAISAYCGDDALDYDIGYRGGNQFIIVYQDSTEADRGGEHDGGDNPEDGVPYAHPVFYNVTSVGNAGSRAITFRDNAGGEYHNSFFVNYGRGVDVELLLEEYDHSFRRFSEGTLKLENNTFYNIGAGTTASDIFKISAQ